MGVYLNPKNSGFKRAIASEIYVDKTGLIEYTNKVLGTEQGYLCVSRPRRFGKSMAANMLCAYYSCGCDSESLFAGLKAEKLLSFRSHLNKHNVIFLNMQDFLSQSHDVAKMLDQIEKSVGQELKRTYTQVQWQESERLEGILNQIYSDLDEQFIFIIDEWDCIFRELKDNEEGQKKYLDYLRNLLKDKAYVDLVYMTGILPIKKYGSHSALNMFTEFSMTQPLFMAEYVGVTETEVKELCDRYQMDFAEIQRWYDGYSFEEGHIYSPRSVVTAMLTRKFSNFWSQTETYEALRIYIEMNFDGLKDAIMKMLSGERCRINIATFKNDMTTFRSKDDVFTLLVHLGYLGYDEKERQVFIPNYEVSEEFINALQGEDWKPVVRAVEKSKQLMDDTWKLNETAVAEALQEMHMTSSVLAYNNENALACSIIMAYYSARLYYYLTRECPAGQGYADVVFIPRGGHMDKPAMIIELKWNRTAAGAIEQIKNREYVKALEGYNGKLLLVGINYDKKMKKHDCIIEEFRL